MVFGAANRYSGRQQGVSQDTRHATPYGLTQYGVGPQGQVESMLFGGTQRDDYRVDAGGNGLFDLGSRHLE